MPIHTHYDNLKVARNAPAEVIRAAYKTLSQKYHPDRNQNNPDANRIIAVINASYEVLSDRKKRQEHDLWIDQQEAGDAALQEKETFRHSPAAQPSTVRTLLVRSVLHVLRNWVLYGLAGFFIWVLANDKPRTPPHGPKPYQATPPATLTTPDRPAYIRPIAAPNGQPWPASAGYVAGYQRLHVKGFSSVTVDNSRNDADVFVKLVSLDGAQAYPVRQFYIPAFGSFKLAKVTKGSYDIRYRDLNNGGLSRSEAFNLKETAIANGTQFSNTTMTLYKVAHGNMQTYSLSESEF